MKFKKVEISIILVVLIVISGITLAFNYSPTQNESLSIHENKSEKSYQILQQWELPKDLVEISGISWLGNQKIACVQDEEGIIYIYNLKTAKIEKTIEFGDKDDFEAITIFNENAYALRSDGTIFEVKNYNNSDFKTRKYDTFMEGKNNTESLALDVKNNRLLMAAKDRDPFSKKSKGIYAFNLETKKLQKKPVYHLNFEDEIFDKVRKKKIKKTFSPSEIAVHPQTQEIYVLEGKKPKLLILNPDGSPKRLIELDKEEFRQPEGMTFAPNGDLYISNEGKKENATILKVALK
ncbi:SdiA-regulated domain-containing protein [Mesonia sp. MT50]|uniref:SdiA-regulated domain-containing protein n=1 Tax=Mesonia profundi TaxID=3070998 RepID=A0ABU1A1U0_9FLAO|nr:SdiA-regulated domain-containing protein [Mesonia profundi]MDQ7917678.1 SdiA-regulated domain-containing protein [Mesonia profundi]